MMKQLQLFKYATIGLLLLNIGVILFFFLTQPKPPGPMPGKPGNHAMDHRVVNLLNLNDEQVAVFRDLARAHSQEMRKINEAQRQALEPYFANLVHTDPEVSADEQLENILQLERRKIEVTYQHFEEVKAILEPSQLSHYDRFVDESLKMILGRGGKNPPPPRRGERGGLRGK
ncbi:MAG: hypothetical protein DWQ02_00200 [Bacteroidetes bacterium]|nr:MAG: hypothetical protein DWQ02_00200 [Bacteroidota bacterium]